MQGRIDSGSTGGCTQKEWGDPALSEGTYRQPPSEGCPGCGIVTAGIADALWPAFVRALCRLLTCCRLSRPTCNAPFVLATSITLPINVYHGHSVHGVFTVIAPRELPSSCIVYLPVAVACAMLWQRCEVLLALEPCSAKMNTLEHLQSSLPSQCATLAKAGPAPLHPPSSLHQR